MPQGEDRDATRESASREHACHIHEKGVCAGPIFRAPAATLIPPASITAWRTRPGLTPATCPIYSGSDARPSRGGGQAGHPEGGEKNSLFQAGGTSLVIHAGADDYVTIPPATPGLASLRGDRPVGERRSVPGGSGLPFLPPTLAAARTRAN